MFRPLVFPYIKNRPNFNFRYRSYTRFVSCVMYRFFFLSFSEGEWTLDKVTLPPLFSVVDFNNNNESRDCCYILFLAIFSVKSFGSHNLWSLATSSRDVFCCLSLPWVRKQTCIFMCWLETCVWWIKGNESTVSVCGKKKLMWLYWLRLWNPIFVGQITGGFWYQHPHKR